jgi:beta-galactosidase
MVSATKNEIMSWYFRVLFISFLFISFNSTAQTNYRVHSNFDDNWKFHFGHAADPTEDFNYSITAIFAKSGKTDNTALDTKFNDTSWRTIDLPHDWAVELPFERSANFDVQSHGFKPVGGLYPETSVGWYRKHFSIARKDSGQRFQIQFDGIFRDANIWINGFYLGNNQSGYIGVAYDITDYINFDRENVLVVRADASQYEGWFYEGAGIYRHVWLNQYNNVHIAHDGVFVHTNTKGSASSIQVETTLENQQLYPAQCSVYTVITDRNGNTIAQSTAKPLSLAVNETNTVKQNITLKNAHLWSLDNPYLYRVTSIIKMDGKVIDSVTQRFGIRNIEVKPNGLFVNGKHIKIKGTNNHQDHAGVGAALPDYLQYYRIQLLKDLGSNAYRTSHHAPTPELLDACDSLGMLVMDEQRLLNSSPEYMSQFERHIKRDRNHASVFMWSIGNEEGWIQTNTVGKRIAQTMLSKQRELDPTRTSTYAADVANVYNGVNEVIPVRGFNYRQFGVEAYHKDHPLQPIIGTEMGSTVTTRGIYEKDTIRAYVPDQDITAPWWASKAEDWWTLAAPNDYWLGGFIWTGFDYRGEPTPYEWPNITSHFGVMDVCGFPKNIYYYYQSWWLDKDVIHISPHWNWQGKEGQPIDVWVNSNADNVELFLNGKSFGKKDMPRNRHLQWSVPYQPGSIQAVGYRNGKRITTTIETNTEAYEIKVSADRTSMFADGKDATVVNVTVLDKQGREVPTTNNLVQFSVVGDAKIIGVGNGDPSSHEADKCDNGSCQRHLFNGKCQLILQSGKAAGRVVVTASSAGLQPASITVETIKP